MSQEEPPRFEEVPLNDGDAGADEVRPRVSTEFPMSTTLVTMNTEDRERRAVTGEREG